MPVQCWSVVLIFFNGVVFLLGGKGTALRKALSFPRPIAATVRYCRRRSSNMDPKTAISCLIFWSIFQSTLASSCELVIKVTHLKKIIKNQTRAIETQTQVNDELRNLVIDQAAVIADLRKNYGNIRQMVRDVTIWQPQTPYMLI